MADEPEEVAAEPEAEAEPEEGPGGASPCLQDNGSRGSGGGLGGALMAGLCVLRAQSCGSTWTRAACWTRGRSA